MPLYVEPENLRGVYPDKIVDALAAIKSEVGRAAITPRIALNIIRDHFLPLSQDEITEALAIRKEVDWHTIEFIGVYLVWKAAQRSEDGAIGYAILDFYSWARSTNKKAKPINPVDVFSFCKLCWRHTVTNRNYCGYHDPQLNNSNYRNALRKKADFDRVYKELAKDELDELHNSNNTYKSFFQKKNQKVWLATVRPTVWEVVAPQIGDCPEEDFLKLLLRELDVIPAETTRQKEIRDELHADIIECPHLITQMLLLAEVWLRVEKMSDKTRGGKRLGAGRKREDSWSDCVNKQIQNSADNPDIAFREGDDMASDDELEHYLIVDPDFRTVN